MIAGLPKSDRTRAAIDDEMIDLAARFPKDSIDFARLKASLQGLGVKVADWVQLVRRRRSELFPELGKMGRQSVEQDDRPKIIINRSEEFEINEQASAAIAALPNVYQRFGALVRVVNAKRRRPGIAQEQVVPEIRSITQPLLRELFTRAACWCEAQQDRESGCSVLVRVHPPDWSVKAVHDWATWPKVNHLHHVSEVPVIFADGTVVSTPGYDRRTGILYSPYMNFPDVPEAPTQEDVKAAAAQILDVVCDFPFETEERRSAWLAALLTPIARWAFEGQNPLFVLDANQSGSGKGLLLKVISWIVLGREMDFLTPTHDEEEERKRITSKILKGETMVLIDNIDKPFGSATLEGLLTTGVWSDRLLGSNNAPTLNAWITWYGSGNNVQFKREDTRRRSCVIRLMTNETRPEERNGFKYPNLQRHVLMHRAELFVAALTMLRGWILAGKRAAELPGWGGGWGSFDDWDQVVRGTVLYAGLADPIGAKATKDELGTANSGLQELVDGLEEACAQLDPKRKEVRASEVLDALVENDEWRRSERNVPVRFKKLREAISILLPTLQQGRLPNQNQLGSLFGRYRGKPIGPEGNEKRIMARTLNGNNVWRVDRGPFADVEREAIQEEDTHAPRGPHGCLRPDCDCRPCSLCRGCTALTPLQGGCTC
ncbi:hypothetical protein [Sorangium sp. So ce341]|uniref:hypothetical protein n=1 Tax=Sorangium sp. So ce341 TaxID=3133302 RepID=UPI003F6295F8